MGFRPDVFFAAFQRAGMLVPAVYTLTALPFSAGWSRPDQLLLADEAQSTEFELEFETAAIPRLKRGDPLQVDGANYTVRSAPRLVRDGYFSRVLLDKV